MGSCSLKGGMENISTKIQEQNEQYHTEMKG